MATIEIKPGDLGRVLRERLKKDAGLAKRAALDAAHRGVALAVRRTNQVGAVDTGFFKRAWKAGETRDGAELVNDAPYAGIIEFGRAPGASPPPVAPIARWAIRKLGVEPEEAEDIAQAIAFNIARNGIPPKFILRSLRKRLGRIYVQEIVKRIRKGT